MILSNERKGIEGVLSIFVYLFCLEFFLEWAVCKGPFRYKATCAALATGSSKELSPAQHHVPCSGSLSGALALHFPLRHRKI